MAIGYKKYCIMKLKHSFVSLQNKLTLLIVLRRDYFKSAPSSFLRLGSHWGGWWVESSFLYNSEERLLISAGLGGDISFETEIANYGVKIIGIDPDPKCHQYINTIVHKDFFEKRYIAALSKFSGMKTLYKHEESNFDSWTDEKIAGDRPISKEFETIGIIDLYSNLSISKQYSYVYFKMDVEGSEEEVLHSILESQLKFGYLAVEFDFLSLISARSLFVRVDKIRLARLYTSSLYEMGYRLIFHEDFNLYWKFEDPFITP
jgi:FkbM family methyltransferase